MLVAASLDSKKNKKRKASKKNKKRKASKANKE